ncbi:MAG: aminotransferase class III-fold pyridoxal phosphate-dependent enzyme, partial [Chloroflexota bacterium]|nr:aminotransferase class III-fold pyridoxal phosphate-dependent enzyme [Chloroflexota bacterium]
MAKSSADSLGKAKKVLDRDTEFFPKLIGVEDGGKSDYAKGTGIYHPRNREVLERLQKHAMKKTLVLIQNGEYSITCDPAKPAIGLTCHDYAGNRLMDFNAHVGVKVLGYNHPSVTAKQKQIARIVDENGGILSIGAGTDFPIVSDELPDAIDLNELLVDTAKKSGFKKIAKAGGWSTGTEAVENCMKVAYDWKKRKLFQKWGKNAEKYWKTLEEKLGYPLFGIAADKCFHGRTGYSLSMTHSKPTQYAYFPKISGIKHINYISKDSKEDFNIYDLVDIEPKWDSMRKLNRVLDNGKIPIDLLAFICLEPVQGEGGYVIPKKDFIKGMVEFCQKNDV